MASLADGLGSFPDAMRPGLLDAVDRCSTDAPISMIRRDAMAPGVALMAGLALDPVGRPALDDVLGRYAAPLDELPERADEVIVGGGAHAAVYSSVRVALGFPAPLVLDAGERFGGTFGSTVAPSFFLNSRNRPGPVGAPGTRDALNVLPGAPMQPADIGGSEYQTDADLGLVVRCALALNSTIRRARVERVEPVGNGGAVVETERGRVLAGRVIVATGVGVERRVSSVEPDESTVYSFGGWMRRVGTERFPLAGLGRVAVIGAGDGARTVVESLAGIGPSTSCSTSTLDYVERIDWYGIRSCASSRTSWVENNRTRYQRLGALFPVSGRDNARVNPLDRAGSLDYGYRVANIDGRPYDTVIVAAGYRLDLPAGVDASTAYRPNGRTLGRVERGIVRVGPCADIPFDSTEDQRIGENRVGLFRLAPRTAALAAQLGSPA